MFYRHNGVDEMFFSITRELRAENARLRAELAALRGPDYIIIPRTMLLELGDKMEALQAAIDRPVTPTTGE